MWCALMCACDVCMMCEWHVVCMACVRDVQDSYLAPPICVMGNLDDVNVCYAGDEISNCSK